LPSTAAGEATAVDLAEEASMAVEAVSTVEAMEAVAFTEAASEDTTAVTVDIGAGIVDTAAPRELAEAVSDVARSVAWADTPEWGAGLSAAGHGRAIERRLTLASLTVAGMDLESELGSEPVAPHL
jgi:hypothetical protein